MSKLVLVLNCGSSSLKFAVVDAQSGEQHLSGLAECLHLPEARIKWKLDGKHEAQLGEGAAHDEALSFIVETILASKPELAAQLKAIGHRVVHGGEQFTQSALIDDAVLKGIEDCAALAPLHNPAHIIGIKAAQKAFPELKKCCGIRHCVPPNNARRSVPVRSAIQPVQRARYSSLRHARYVSPVHRT